MTAPDEISGNVTGLLFAEETAPKVISGTPTFYRLEPNSYSGFGGDVKTVSRKPINPGRQQRKGTVVDVDAKAGYVTDFTSTNVRRQFRHFMCSDWYEKATTVPWNSAAIVPGAVTTTDDRYAVASGGTNFKVPQIILAAGYGVAGNNGIKVVDESSALYVGVTGNLVNEATPPATASLKAVGIQFAADDLALTVSGGLMTLTSAALTNLNAMNIKINEWHFIGGDLAVNCYASCPAGGYARVSAVNAGSLVYDKVTWAAANDAGTGKSIQLWFGEFIKNERDRTLQVFRTATFERTLGDDGDGTQSELVLGGSGDEFTLHFPTADKLTADMTYKGLDADYRNGTEGPVSEAVGATIVEAPNEEAINSSSNVYRVRATFVDTTTLQPTPFFVYFESGELAIKNNYKTRKAVSVVGGFKNSPGQFEVMASCQFYFGTIAAVQAMRANTSVTWDAIIAVENKGYVFDIPLLTAATKGIDVKLDDSIMVPLEQSAFEGPNGFTLGVTYFPYLPNTAMAEA